MNKISYAIIGCGSMGMEHIRNIALIENAEVTALCDNYNQSINNSLEILNKKVPTFNNHIDLLNLKNFFLFHFAV